VAYLLDTHEFRAKANIKLNKFKKLKEGQVENLKEAWDSDDDLSNYNFKLSEKVDM
jgi:hypothetical protein